VNAALEYDCSGNWSPPTAPRSPQLVEQVVALAKKATTATFTRHDAQAPNQQLSAGSFTTIAAAR
jgi:hypothetical protein